MNDSGSISFIQDWPKSCIPKCRIYRPRTNIFSCSLDPINMSQLFLKQYRLAIKRTPHFRVRSALAPALNFGGVRMTAPTLLPHCTNTSKKLIFCEIFFKKMKKKYY